MPDLTTSINYLADLELYKTEKPYACIISPSHSTENIETSNLEFEKRPGIHVTDIRGKESEYSVESSGFVVITHQTQLITVSTWDEIHEYKRETEEVLSKWFDAEVVFCFDVKVGLISRTCRC